MQATQLRLILVHYPPFNDKGAKTKGFTPEVIRAVLEGSEYTVELSFSPYAKALASVMRGEAEVTTYSPLGLPEQLRELIDSGEPLFFTQDNFFYNIKKKREGVSWQQLSDLKGLKIGVVPNYPSTRQYQELGLRYITYGSQAELILQLIRGRIDLWAVSDMTGYHLVRQHYPRQAKNIRMAESHASRQAIYLGVSKKFTQAAVFRQTFKERYAKLLASGDILAIAEKYCGKGRVPSYFLPKPELAANASQVEPP